MKISKSYTNIPKQKLDNNDNSNLNKLNNNLAAQRNWLKYDNFSCRHDSFFLIYTFIIYNKLKLVNDET